MAKKFYYYVLVCNNKGVKFVTGVGRYDAVWDYTKPPKCMTKRDAEKLAVGLGLNGHRAFVVCMPYEIEDHIYNYNEYEMQFVAKGE